MQNTSINMEKIPECLFQGHQQQGDSVLEVDLDNLYYKHPSAFRMKTFMAILVILSGIVMCCFLTSALYFRFGHKHKVVHYRALCAVPNFDNYNETIPYSLIQTDELESNWRTFIAPQIFEDLMDDYPYGYFFREEIEFNVTDDSRIHAAINILDVTNSFSTRFLYNFNKNQTAIVDFINNRCFIMKLNHNVTMSAHELLLSMQRMEYIYSIPHGGRLILPKRIVLPAVADLSFADKQMIRDCHDKYIYILIDFLLEDENPVDELITEDACFYEFFGRGITEYSLVNLNEIISYEKQLQTSDAKIP